MSKIRFDLKKLQVPPSVRLAGRILQAVDTLIHENTAELVSCDLFARGREQGFTLLLNDWKEQTQLRVAFARGYNSDRAVVYYAPIGNMGEFMRALTSRINGENSPVKMEFFCLDEIQKAAEFIRDYFETLEN